MQITNTCANDDLQVQMIILLNEESEYGVTSLPVKLQVDWCQCTEVLIDSHKCYYNGLEIIKNE